MLIKRIDILIHPDYYQMGVPYLPFNERQLELRSIWSERIESIIRSEESMLLHFSYLSRKRLFSGIADISLLDNKVEKEEVNRVKRCLNLLGKRFIPFGFLEIPDEDDFKRLFKEHNIAYDPSDTKIRVYGEIFEVCVRAWGYQVGLALGIPDMNIQFCSEDSLTNKDCKEIDDWRFGEIRTNIRL